MTEPLWPHPPRRPGGRIRHRVLCSRQGDITQATRRTPDGTIVDTERCSECQADDYPERLLGRATPHTQDGTS